MEHRKKKSPIKLEIEISLTCKKCGYNSKSKAGLSSHIRWTHDETYESYVLKYYNIDIIKLEYEYKENKGKRLKEHTIGQQEYYNSIKGKSVKDRLGEEGHKTFLESMKGVFLLEWFIKKYGEVEGTFKYKERSAKISEKSYFKIYNKKGINKNSWSNISQELFNRIYEIVGDKFDKIYFGDLNHEYSCGVQNHNYDFVVLDNKKIIEFNGDKFHGNPEIYNENDIPLKFINKTAKELWISDEEKNNKAINNGFEIMVVWEKEYLKNKEKIILECIEYLLTKNKNKKCGK